MSRDTRRAFGVSWSTSEQEFAHRLLSRHRKQLRRVERSSGGPRGKHRFEIRRSLESYPARFCAAARVLDRQYRQERQKKHTQKAKDAIPKPTFQKVEELAKRVCPYHAPKEPIHTWTKSKSGGGQRTYAAFGPRRRGQQLLVKDVLGVVVADAMPRDYALFGGSKRAIERIVDFETNESGGGDEHEYVIADIKAFYDSIALKGLEAVLPLPIRTIRNIVHPNTGTHENKTNSPVGNASHTSPAMVEGDSLERGLVGLPIGSAASNVVGAYVLQDALAPLAKHAGVIIYIYADDILVHVANGEAPAVERELRRLLRNHPAGPLEVKSSICNASNGFAFLGYYLSVVSQKYGGQFRARPSYDARDAFRARLVSDVHFQYTSVLRHKIAYGYLEAWIRSFPAWQPTSRERDYFALMVGSLCELMDYYDRNVPNGLDAVDRNGFKWCRGPCGGEWAGPNLK